MPKGLKDKHRDRLWWDEGGALWLFNSSIKQWTAVLETWEEDGYCLVLEYPDEEWGPYRLAVPKSG